MEPLILNRFNDLQPIVDSYEPPKIEILEISVEKGFADSTGTDPWGDGGSW